MKAPSKLLLRTLFLCGFLITFIPVQATEQSDRDVATPKQTSGNAANFERADAYNLRKNPNEPRSYFLMPLASFFVPGLDQWIEGQTLYAGLYSGLYLGGAVYLEGSKKLADDRHGDLAGQIMEASMSLSMYHNFRSAVRTHQSEGKFAFLRHEESPTQLALSPFRVSYLKRETTLIPFLLAAGLGFVGFSADDRKFNPGAFTVGDGVFGFASGYHAGFSEELIFRGWMMPLIAESTGSPFAGNLLSSLAFGAVHYRNGGRPADYIPWSQFLFGLYQGYVIQKDEWRLGEAIFIHAWYDILLFLGDYLRKNEIQSVSFPTLMLHF